MYLIHAAMRHVWALVCVPSERLLVEAIQNSRKQLRIPFTKQHEEHGSPLSKQEWPGLAGHSAGEASASRAAGDEYHPRYGGCTPGPALPDPYWVCSRALGST